MEETVKGTILDVPIELRTRLRGKYNALVSRCYNCGEEIGSWVGTLIGFSDSDMGLMQIHECNKCFRFQKFHVKTIGYLKTLILSAQLHPRTTKEAK